jgi:hypothetical protein
MLGMLANNAKSENSKKKNSKLRRKYIKYLGSKCGTC